MAKINDASRTFAGNKSVSGGARFSAAASTIDITPSDAHDMGSGPRKKDVSTDGAVQEPLEANFLLLRNASNFDDAVLIVTLDLLYPGPTVREAIERAAPQLDPSRIVVAASHTHRAPLTVPNAETLGQHSPGYLRQLCTRLEEQTHALLAPEASTPAELFVGSTQAAHTINRRRRKWFLLAKKPRWNFIANAPNPRGPTDETLTLAAVRAPDGSPLAYLWNYACHPVSHPDARRYSSHFPYVVRKALRGHTAASPPMLFLQGFSGDVRPSASRRVHKPMEVVRRILSGPLFDDMTWRSYRRWAASLAHVAGGLLERVERVERATISANRITVPGAEFASPSKPFVFQAIGISDSFRLIAMNGEPVTHYAKLIRSWFPKTPTMCAGCIDDVVGYIPTNEMIREGGYESDTSRVHFGMGEYAPDFEQRVVSYLEAVSAEITPSSC